MSTPTKPGFKTTEFWLSVIATLVGIIMTSGVISSESGLKALGIVAAALAAMGYSVSRAWVKSAETKAETIQAAIAANPSRPSGPLV